MISTKYLIMIGAIICLLIIYYFYNGISDAKKMIFPAYQKTMALEIKTIALEEKITELEKKTADFIPKKKQLIHKNDSPALSITYQSDMVKNGNLSVKYADLSESEAAELLKHIDQNKNKQISPINNSSQISHNIRMECDAKMVDKINGMNNVNHFNNQKKIRVQNGELSDFDISHNKNNCEETDTINIKINDLIKNDYTNMQSKDMVILDYPNLRNETIEYKKILDGLSSNIKNIYSEDDAFGDDTEIDQDIIKSITETIQYADIPSDTILSDIPIPKTNKNTKKTINNNKQNNNNNQKKI